MMLRSLQIWIAGVLCAIAGCSSIHECINEQETELRNHILAQKAWGEWSWCYDELAYPMHFAKGFKAGYTDILEGGPGCQPTLPPRCYWKPHYQNAEGRAKTNAWFDGFSHGALAAQQDGHSNMGQIPISPTARANLMSRHAQGAPSPWTVPTRQPAPVPDLYPASPDQFPEMTNELSPLLPTVGPDGEPMPLPVKPYEE